MEQDDINQKDTDKDELRKFVNAVGAVPCGTVVSDEGNAVYKMIHAALSSWHCWAWKQIDKID